jgi:hypothetical protein
MTLALIILACAIFEMLLPMPERRGNPPAPGGPR